MTTLCFGGSFNPIHHGHLICARAVAEMAGFERILLIPSAQPPHKPNSPDLAAAEHRLAMCRRAIAGDPLFNVDDIEMRQTGTSYTLNTVRLLRQLGMVRVSWLIGADMLNFLPNWHQPLKLMEEVQFVVMARPGFQFDWSSLPAEYQPLRDHVVEAPRIEISSTEIRRRVKLALPLTYLTPPAVADYIRGHHLYL
jgi:nicotinate-nucleotide adenylyltransferase